MSAPGTPAPVAVRGGSDGIAAHIEELMALSAAFTRARAELDDLHGRLVFVLGSLSRDEQGPFGVLEEFGRYDVAALLALGQVRACVEAALGSLRAAAFLCAGICDALRHAIAGYVFGEVNLVRQLKRLGASTVSGQTTLLHTGNPVLAGEAVVTADPGAYYQILRGLFCIDQEVLQLTTIDGPGVARATGNDARGVAGRPPRDLEDLITDLAQRNSDPRHGEIDVRILTMPDGSRKAVVDITGTKEWGLSASDPADLRTNLVAINGRRTAYEEGVLDAMRQAGVTGSDDVMLIGHSQGGMIAVNTAAHLARTTEFRVTHVITAGAPIGRGVRAVASRTQVLALEDRRDIVPLLDDRANPDRPNVSTASTDHGDGTFGGDHDLTRSYLPGAVDVERSDNPSLRHVLGTMKGYFGARSVSTHTFQIRRV